MSRWEQERSALHLDLYIVKIYKKPDVLSKKISKRFVLVPCSGLAVVVVSGPVSGTTGTYSGRSMSSMGSSTGPPEEVDVRKSGSSGSVVAAIVVEDVDGVIPMATIEHALKSALQAMSGLDLH